MSIHEETYEQIEAYLGGELNPEQQAAFEERIRQDEHLARTVAQVRKINEMMFAEGLKTDLNKIRQAERSYFFLHRIKWLSKWIGGITGAVLLGVWVWTLSSPKKNLPTTKSTPSTDRTQSSSVLPQESQHSSTSIYSKSDRTSNQTVISDAVVVSPSVSGQSLSQDVSDTAVAQRSYVPAPSNTAGNNSPPSSTKNPCEGIIIDLRFESQASCAKVPEGSCTLTDIKGGRGPFAFNFNRQGFKSDRKYSFLAPGDYTLQARDAAGCLSPEYKVQIAEKDCPKANPVHLAFSYRNSTELVLPETTEDQVVCKIYNSAEQIITSFPIEPGIAPLWNGLGAQQQTLATGLYILRYERDGQIVLQGTITILN